MAYDTPLTEQEITAMQEFVRTHKLDHRYDDWFDGIPDEQELLRAYIMALESLGKMPK